MKLSIVFATVACAQKAKKPDMAKFKAAMAEVSSGARNDGNALLVQQQVEFYLAAEGRDIALAPKMLSYGCWCQLVQNRLNGVGEPVDEFDAICKKYQACSRCTAVDNEGELTAQGEVCSWSTARYEISFDGDSSRFFCDPKTTKSTCGQNQCSERLLEFHYFRKNFHRTFIISLVVWLAF